jgi:hypothetical protein
MANKIVKKNNRSQVLAEANELINGDRNNQYGEPTDDFRKTADLWSVYLTSVAKAPVTLLPHDVAVLMMMLKVSRIAWSPNKRDNWTDLAGYAACGWDCVVAESLNDD